MELSGHEKRMVFELHDFHQIIGWVDARGYHAGFGILIEVVVVEFITVAVAFRYLVLTIDSGRFGALFDLAVIRT